MKKKELQSKKEKTSREVEEEAKEARKKLINFRYELASGKGKNPTDLKKLKTTLAQLLTIAKEKKEEGK